MKKTAKIDLVKLIFYMLSRAWFIVLVAALGFGALYLYTTRTSDTYSNVGTMYISNGDYLTNEEENSGDTRKKYVASTDLDAGEGLATNYLTIIKSDMVMDEAVTILQQTYPDITKKYVLSSMRVETVVKTGVLVVRAVAKEPQLAADIVNAVLTAASYKITEIVGGEAVIIDRAVVWWYPDDKGGLTQGVLGGLAGAVLAVAVLFFLFLLNNKITDENDLLESYTPPVLGTVRTSKNTTADHKGTVFNELTTPEILEEYSMLQVRLLHALEEQKGNSVVITSAAKEEQKSVFAANFAVSCALSGIKVLLVDCNFKENGLEKLFNAGAQSGGLSGILEEGAAGPDSIIKDVVNGMDLIPAGRIQGSSVALLRSARMQSFLEKAAEEYELVLLDMPAINQAADPLVISKYVAGSLVVTSKEISDHKEIRKALISAEMSGMDVLGFVLCEDNPEHKAGGRKKHRRLGKKDSKEDGKKDDVKDIAEETAKDITEDTDIPQAVKTEADDAADIVIDGLDTFENDDN